MQKVECELIDGGKYFALILSHISHKDNGTVKGGDVLARLGLVTAAVVALIAAAPVLAF